MKFGAIYVNEHVYMHSTVYVNKNIKAKEVFRYMFYMEKFRFFKFQLFLKWSFFSICVGILV